jgi:hypothetical protein
MLKSEGTDQGFNQIKEKLSDEASALFILSRNLGNVIGIQGGGFLINTFGY